MPHHPERRQAHREQWAQIDRRNWQLWVLSFAVTLCLAFAIVSFFYPAIRWHVDRLEILYGVLPQLILGLLTLILLCIVYIVVKQRELNELRNFLIAINFEAKQLREEFPKDPLTQVLDRRVLPDVLKREVTWVDRYRIPLSFLLLNICGFQRINEQEGNLAADRILKELARTMEVTARQTDSILRYSPDRFLCFLPRTDRKGAEAFGRRVYQACAQSATLRSVLLQFGVAVYQAGGVPEKMLAEVERNLAQGPRSAAASPVPAGAPHP